MNLLLLAAAILANTSTTHAKAGPEIFVRIDSTVPIERLAAAVHPIGMIESKIRGTRCYLIQLNAGVDDEKAKQRLEKIPGIVALEPQQEPVDMNSIRSIDRKIAHLTQDEDSDTADKGDKKGTDNDAGLDYIEAYRYFVGLRAFPNDSFDWSSLGRARAYAHKMPATRFPPFKPRSGAPSSAQAWQFMGPTNLQVPPNAIDFGFGPTNGRVNAVAFDPTNPQTIYAGAAQGGLWKSTNAGATWNWLSSTWSQLAVNCIAIDPTNTDIIYAGLGDYQGLIGGSQGLEKSTDGGQTWTLLANNVQVASILLDPTNHLTVIIGTGGTGAYGGIFVSPDGGQTWATRIDPPGSDEARFPTLAVSVVNSTTINLYAVEAGLAGSTGSNGRIFFSSDHGQSWGPLQSPVEDTSNFHWAYSIATSPTNPKNIYVLDSQNQKLYTSVNTGTTWKDVSANLPTGDSVSKNYNFSQSGYDYYLSCGTRVNGSTNSDVLYLGMIDIQESLDQGGSWSTIGGPTWQTLAAGAISHNDQHCFAVCPTNPNLSLFGNDGGVYQLTYNPTTNKNAVASLNQNLGNTMFYKIACHPTDPNYVFGGTQDNSTPFANGDLGNWLNRAYGDGGGVALNQQNPLMGFATSENTHIYWTQDGWKTENDISPSPPKSDRTPFVTPVALVTGDQTWLYSGTNFFYAWNASSQIWSRGQDLTNGTGTISLIVVAPSDPNRIYVGTSDGALQMSADAGNTWVSLPQTVSAAPTSITVNPTNPTDIIVGYSGSGISHLWRAKNTTTGRFMAWSNVSGTGTTALPDSSLNGITRDIDDPQNTWYVATDVGIFQSSDAGTTWTNAGFAYGLPDVIVNDIVAVPGTRFLNVGTYGRGMWRLYLPPGNTDLNSFNISPDSVQGGSTSVGTVTLTKPAPSGGTTIALTGDSRVSFPSSVTVAAGATSANFTVSTNAVASGFSANITATQVSISLSASLTVQGANLQSVVNVPATVAGGTQSFGQVNLTGDAPTGGIVVSLSASVSGVTVPTTVTVPAGLSSILFAIKTPVVTTYTTATITAKAGGITKTAALGIEPATLQSVSLSTSSIVGGSKASVTGTLTFNGPTPPAGVVVKLASNDKTAATVPGSVTAKLTGSTWTVSFILTHLKVKTTQNVTITATSGNQSFTANLQVIPFQLVNISLAPSTVTGGTKSTGAVTLNAIPGPTSGAISVTLTTSAKVIGLPKSVSVAVGQSTGSFTITTDGVSLNTQAIIYGAIGSSTQQVTLYIDAPVLVGIAVKPTSVQGSSTTTVTGTVGISGPAPTTGIVIKLGTNDPAVTGVPASITIRSGQTTVTFRVTHKRVSSQITVTLGATYNGVTKTTPLVVTK